MKHSKKVLFMIAILFLSVSGFSQSLYDIKPRDSNYSGPWREGASIRFDTTKVKLEVQQGDNTLFIFSYVNDGNEPLILTSVKSSCGCLVPYATKDPIMPGQRSEIYGKYDSSRIGPINKTITVVSNAIDEMVVLRVLGKIDSVEVHPLIIPHNE